MTSLDDVEQLARDWKQRTGGYAFSQSSGMTLRDYFAAKAANGYITSLEGRLNYVPPSTIAGYAYEIADAMLAAREVKL